MIPKHLAPIINQLLRHEHLKVPKKTIVLERENIKDNFRAYSRSENLFHTMNEQELLLRKSQDLDRSEEVCPTCYQVYQFLHHTYYEAPAVLDDECPVNQEQ